jgi:hypothetical protein
MNGGSDRYKKYKKWMVVVVDTKKKMNGGSGRCKKYKKWMMVVVDVKNTKNEWW